MAANTSPFVYRLLSALGAAGGAQPIPVLLTLSAKARRTVKSCERRGWVVTYTHGEIEHAALTHAGRGRLHQIEATRPTPKYVLAARGEAPMPSKGEPPRRKRAETTPPPSPPATPAVETKLPPLNLGALPDTIGVQLLVTLQVPVELYMGARCDAQAVAEAAKAAMDKHGVGGYLAAYDVTSVTEMNTGKVFFPAPRPR